MLPLALLLSIARQPSVPAHPAAPGDQMAPSAVFTSEGLVVAYLDRRADRSEVVYVHSPDLSVFSAPVPAGAAAGDETIRPRACASGDRAAIVWADAAGGDHDVRAAVSNDGGRTFEAPIVAAAGPGGQLDPTCAVLDDGTIAVAFHDSAGSTAEDRGVVWRVKVASAPDGATFTPPSEIPGQAPETFHLHAAIAASGSDVQVTWIGDGVWAARSSDRGASFGLAERIDRGTPGTPIAAAIAGVPSGFLVVFGVLAGAEGQARPEIFRDEPVYLDLMAVTSTEAEPTVATEDRTLHQMHPDVAASDGRIALAYLDHASPGVRRILLRRGDRSDLGATAVVSDGDADVGHPSVAYDGTTAVVVWEDARGGSFDVRASIVR